MNSFIYFLTIVVMFNYLFQNVLADNNYYIISIRRNSKDKEYDKANEKIKNEIDELVNDRMNDIYEIIENNKETYVTENGKVDEKINEELLITSQLRKRNVNGNSKSYKFKFINKNRPQKNNNYNLNSKSDKKINYIPLESNLIKHICPVSNYYVVIAFLSKDIVNKIKSLPNVINCVESKNTEMEHTIKYKIGENKDSKYYNKEEILNETHWKNLGVQEYNFDFELRNSHLSLISQGKYDEFSNSTYDNNYYYPSSAGKGIDVYVIDGGLDTSLSQDDFDTYEGTPDERIIRCDGEIYDGEYHSIQNEKSCHVRNQENIEHGTLVAITALGKINGVAKKANLHMVATAYKNYDELAALDYIKQKAKPHKTVVNISRGCSDNINCYSQEIQDKINELVDLGIIIFVSGGNSNRNSCKNQTFRSCNGVIPIGAVNNIEFENFINKEDLYERAYYSSYGECIVLFAPGTIRVRDSENNIIMMESGTSFASPVVAGVASTIMAENPEIKYNFDLMKNKLIELSIKDKIKRLNRKTPNRLVNNGKNSIYHPPRCDDSSNNYHCQNQCCSKYGYCVEPETYDTEIKSLCLIENGCISEFGHCQ